jgi:cytochrome c oxidase subunit 4
MTSHTHHIIPIRTYLTIFALLIGLTFVTVFVAKVDFGSMNIIVAMIIAGVKASLVAFFFMHLLYDDKVNLFVFLTAIVFLAVFIIFTLLDTERRADIDPIKAKAIEEKAAIIYDKIESEDHSGH